LPSSGASETIPAVFADKKTREQKLLESGGTIAWATVLEAREKSQSETPGLSGVQLTSHMHLKLRVEPEGEPAFEASFGQALTNALPFTGGSCKVVFDPVDRSRIAMIDGSAAAHGVSPDPHYGVADQLTKLADLKDRGVLTDTEFESAKAKLLSKS
jgi:hypothetical protein